MGRVANAWREDRGRFLIIFGWLALGVGQGCLSWGRGWLFWAFVVAYLGLAVNQALDVLVVRPRRLERTGQRRKPRRGDR